LYKVIFSSALKSEYYFLSVNSGWCLRADETDVLLPAPFVVIYTTQGEDEESMHTGLSYRE